MMRPYFRQGLKSLATHGIPYGVTKTVWRSRQGLPQVARDFNPWRGAPSSEALP
jgi:hypothetical protein